MKKKLSSKEIIKMMDRKLEELSFKIASEEEIRKFMSPLK